MHKPTTNVHLYTYLKKSKINFLRGGREGEVETPQDHSRPASTVRDTGALSVKHGVCVCGALVKATDRTCWPFLVLNLNVADILPFSFA